MPVRSMPVYKQTSDFSCGAASLVMALHVLRGDPVSRSREWELWRQATMIGIPGIDQWGLALAARQAGVAARVVAQAPITFPYRRGRVSYFSEAQVELTMFAQEENRAKAGTMDVAFEQRAPTVEDVTGALDRGVVPVLLVDLYTLSNGADGAPHWVVAAQHNNGTFTVHDPAPEGPGVHQLSRSRLWECMDVSRYGAVHTVVLLGG